jgi:DNA-binding transcriptional regulator YiaG
MKTTTITLAKSEKLADLFRYSLQNLTTQTEYLTNNIEELEAIIDNDDGGSRFFVTNNDALRVLMANREKMVFADKLKSVRLRLGMTRGEAAILLDMSVSIIEKWESGARTPAKITEEGALRRFANAPPRTP